MSWNQIKEACAAAGKRMPTLAEWQTAYSGYDGADWPWGDEYDPDQVKGCYIKVTVPPLPILSFPTGGCCFENCGDGGCFTTCDMLGNLSEFVDGYWDESCFGHDQILVAGGGLGDWMDPNWQVPDNSARPAHSSAGTQCWHWSFISQTRASLHHHNPTRTGLYDDGFRCAKSVNPNAAPDDGTVADDDRACNDDSDDRNSEGDGTLGGDNSSDHGNFASCCGC